MSRYLYAFSILLLAAPLAIPRSNPDEEAVRRTVSYYLDGGRAGDSATVARAFNKVAMMYFVRDSQLAQMPIFPDYLNRVGAPRQGPRPPDKREIVSVDISGNAAVAKLRIESQSATLVDYMSLLKINGEWQIVNKIFSRQ